MAKRKLHRSIYQKIPKWGKFVSFLGLMGIFFLFAILSFLSVFIYFAKDLPRPERFFTERPFVESTKIYDRTGSVLLYELYGEEKREVVSLDKIPQHLINAVFTAEDLNFYNHF